MTHPLTDKKSDRYLQLGWDWAIDAVEVFLNNYITEHHHKTHCSDELVEMHRKLMEAMRPQGET